MEVIFCTLYVTTVEYLCQWLLYILNMLGSENGATFYTLYVTTLEYLSMVTIYTEHTRSRKWKPHFVHYMLLQ